MSQSVLGRLYCYPGQGHSEGSWRQRSKIMIQQILTQCVHPEKHDHDPGTKDHDLTGADSTCAPRGAWSWSNWCWLDLCIQEGNTTIFSPCNPHNWPHLCSDNMHSKHLYFISYAILLPLPPPPHQVGTVSKCDEGWCSLICVSYLQVKHGVCFFTPPSPNHL